MSSLSLLMSIFALLVRGQGLVPVSIKVDATTGANSRLYGNIGRSIGDGESYKLASTIKAAASMQSSNVFKLTRQLHKITDSYTSILDQMNALQEKVGHDLEIKKRLSSDRKIVETQSKKET